MEENDKKKDSESPETEIKPDETAVEQNPVDLGRYKAGEGSDKLDHDQMLGIGGGTEFFELVNTDGTAKKHIAMPVLMRERPIVRDLLKGHAQCMIDMENLIKEATEENIKDGKVAIDLEEIEERDIRILLKVANYCFKRVDPEMIGLDVEAGANHCEQWMDIKQLRRMPEIAMGINRFTPTLRAASQL